MDGRVVGCADGLMFWPLVTVQESRRGPPGLGKFEGVDFPSLCRMEMSYIYKREPDMWNILK